MPTSPLTDRQVAAIDAVARSLSDPNLTEQMRADLHGLIRDIALGGGER